MEPNPFSLFLVFQVLHSLLVSYLSHCFSPLTSGHLATCIPSLFLCALALINLLMFPSSKTPFSLSILIILILELISDVLQEQFSKFFKLNWFFLFPINMILTWFYYTFASLSSVTCMSFDCKSLYLCHWWCYTSFGVLTTNKTRSLVYALLIPRFSILFTLKQVFTWYRELGKTICRVSLGCEHGGDKKFSGFTVVPDKKLHNLVGKKNLHC